MQLVAYGAQDIYLTGNPQITFFKVVYRRHTNFSMESIEQTFNGTVDNGARLTATVSRNGDLVHKMYLVSNASTTIDVANYGHFGLIDNVELEIGGQRIDKQTAQWMETWVQLTEPNPTGAGTPSTTGMTEGTKFQRMAGAGGVAAAGSGGVAYGLLHVPLQFWFCRNAGLALPLIALQYHEVKVILTCGNLAGDSNLALWADYIYLDTDERRRFAQVSHEYLIEQIQEESVAAGPEKTLNFNHPVKELVFSAETANVLSSPFSGNIGLKLNGHDRFAARDAKYFTSTQVWQHHTGHPILSGSVGVYSFALKPEEHQPSGTCNFSRIDNAVVTASSDFNASTIYAVNYNVLRIMSGMGGLAYSN